MSKETPVPLQELVDKASGVFRNPEEPKFPRVREKLFEGLMKLSTGEQVFIASYDHLNPAIPDRMLTGKVRAGEIVKQLAAERVRGVSIILDNLSPESDRQAEGGGWSLGLGIVEDHLTRLLQDNNVFYSQNELLALDTNSIIDNFGSVVETALQQAGITDKVKRSRYQKEIVARLGTILSLYNFSIGEARRTFKTHTRTREPLSPSEMIFRIRKSMEEYLRLGTPWVKEVLQSDMTKNIAAALEQLATEGYPFWNMPGAASEPVARSIDSSGKENGFVHHESHEFAVVDSAGVQIRRIKEKEIFRALHDGEILPTAKLLMLATLAAPQVPHFGNTYGLEQAALDWLQIDGRNLRLTRDYGDSTPLGTVIMKGGRKVPSRLPLDLLHFPRERVTELIKEVATTGEPAFSIKMGDIQSD